MFTGIIQSLATVINLHDQEGLRTITLTFEEGFCSDLQIGASVSVDGVCLTVTRLSSSHQADFDIMLQSLNTTTLQKSLFLGSIVNVERAAKEGAEVGGHLLSGHIDLCGTIIEIRKPVNNHVLRIQVPPLAMRYFFSKGYVAINGASLTISEVNKEEGWFELWLIPETLRKTTFINKKMGDCVNIEIERTTQIMVETIRSTVEEKLTFLLPSLLNNLVRDKVTEELARLVSSEKNLSIQED